MVETLSGAVPADEVPPSTKAIVVRRVPIPRQDLQLTLCPAQDGGHLCVLLADVFDHCGQALRQLPRRRIAYHRHHAATSSRTSEEVTGRTA
jgi:hypothetical protein